MYKIKLNNKIYYDAVDFISYYRLMTQLCTTPVSHTFVINTLQILLFDEWK
jgi:hypothetical protein